MAKYSDVILSFQVEDFNNFMCFNLSGFFKKQEVAVDDLKILKEENYVGENYRF